MRNDGVEGHLQDVGFIDAMNGWAVGSQGLILQTTDAERHGCRKPSRWNARLISGTFTLR